MSADQGRAGARLSRKDSVTNLSKCTHRRVVIIEAKLGKVASWYRSVRVAIAHYLLNQNPIRDSNLTPGAPMAKRGLSARKGGAGG